MPVKREQEAVLKWTEPMRELDKYLNETLDIVDLMLNLADRFDAASEDVGCGVLYGIL